MHRLLILLVLIVSAHLQATINVPANCVCDVTINACDQKCCCDTSCSSQLITNWRSYGMCQPANNNGLAIPSCSDRQSIHISDMNSGLRTIYTVIKRLFCLYSSTANISLAVNSYFPSTSVKSTIDTLTNNFRPLQYVSPYNTLLRDSGISLPSLGIGGRCSLSIAYFGVDKQFVRCNTDKNSQLLKTTSYNQTMLGGMVPNITKYDRNGQPVTSDTSCDTNGCTAAVRSATIQLILSGSDPISSALSKVNIDLIVQDLTFNYDTISQTFQSFWTTQQNLKRSSNVGYKMGSPLIVVNAANISMSLIPIKFIDSTGKCASNSNQQFLDVRFGQDVLITCKGNFSITQFNLPFNKISRLGSLTASQNAKDYVDFDPPTTNSDQISILEISYSRIGTQKNSMFQVVLARMQTRSASTNFFTFGIEFKEIANVPVDYIPPPPTAQLYLPNDVLYPFYVSQ